MRKILLAGASLALVTGLAACAQMSGTPDKPMGMNAPGVTGQLPGTRNENAPAMPSSLEMPHQHNSTILQ